jgi:hypothetical protein
VQNPRDGQYFGFRCALKGKNIGVLAFESDEFVFGYGLITGNEAAGQKEHVNKQNSERNASHNGTSYCV